MGPEVIFATETLFDFDLADNPAPIEMVQEVNNQLSEPPDDTSDRIIGMTDHRFTNKGLKIQCSWNTGETTWQTYRDLKEDQPRKTAEYLVENEPRQSTRGRAPHLTWAKKVIRDLDRSVRCVVWLYDFELDEDNEVRRARRLRPGKQKKALSLIHI